MHVVWRAVKEIQEKASRSLSFREQDTDWREERYALPASGMHDFIKNSDMDAPMLDGYHPQAVEAAWNDWWEQQGYFKPDVKAATEASDEEKFVMVIPPPNVTGSLHLGHALTQSIEDALARYGRTAAACHTP